MNGNFFSTPTFPTNPKPTLETPPGNINFSNTSLPMEQSYIENILRLNKGKKVKVYYSYPDSNEWKDKIYDGVIEAAGRDHLIISDPKTGDWYLLRMIYLNYVTFEERINYNYEYSEKTY